ncbi:MAG: hypothetical protein GY710_26305 [Desulfobacteraceae bacterium]|nr:hypothetical protein [Desulfobacteraceae bacterium]
MPEDTCKNNEVLESVQHRIYNLDSSMVKYAREHLSEKPDNTSTPTPKDGEK